ncbi:MAG: argininosuccinate synthase [Chloroflexi bacterium]|nr:argininosuccinate synthase [Chloroflexota bacterium]MCL5074918.1 argininosuccinate synthase [Chloroflexota bacterium]
MERVILAYSGGLDTSVAIRWLAEKYSLEVIALTVDLGANDRDLEMIREKALKIGAIKAVVVDAKELFVRHFVFPALQAGAIYEGQYPLATALARPLIAKLMVDLARAEGATAVAHGCTGKGNDQVRFDVSVTALAPELRVIAPIREWKMSREEEIEYALKHNIPVPATVRSPYSTDQNLWGRSIECGVLEDPWAEPPEEVYEWTRRIEDTPVEPLYLEIEFEKGIPVAIDGKRLDGVSLISNLNYLAGEHGVGRIDHIENRLIGIKSREIYEAPAAVVLHKAHQSLEDLTLTKDAARFKSKVAAEYADLIYNGLWFSSLHQDLAAYVASSQRHVTGTIRMKLFRGTSQVVGRHSPKSLYSYSLATYDKGDLFDYRAAEGFIKLWGLPLKTQAQVQLFTPAAEIPEIMPPEVGIKNP